MNPRARHTVANQWTYREVNERIREGAQRFRMESEDLALFLCECGRVRCAEAVYLTLGEYAAVRAAPGRFAVVRGHERRGERVSENERFIVVEPPMSAAA